MTQFRDIDEEAVIAEGRTLVRCENPKCKYGNPVLGIQSADGNELQLNENTRTRGSGGRVALTCDCGVTRSWRPSRGPKSPVKPNISAQG